MDDMDGMDGHDQNLFGVQGARPLPAGGMPLLYL
jgi:hypothetical protein